MTTAPPSAPPAADSLGPQPRPSPPPASALPDDLASPDEARALAAVYQACALPPDEALAVAEAAATKASRQALALARVVRDCGLPAAQAVAELEALLQKDPRDPLAAVAVLELHRLGVGPSSPALAAQAQQVSSLSAWLAAYSSSDSR